MKNLIIIIIFLCSSLQAATKNKLNRHLTNCEAQVQQLELELQVAMQLNGCTAPANKFEVQIAKQIEKTKRRGFKADRATTKIEEKNKTKRNLIYQIGSFAKGSTWAFVLLCVVMLITGATIKSFFGFKN